MSSNGNTGYQGFTPSHFLPPPSLKNPSETLTYLSNKYSTVGTGQVYNRRIESETMKFNNGCTFGDDVSVGDYKRADRRGVSVKHLDADPKLRSKRFVGKTMYNETFRDFKGEGDVILSTKVEDYEEVFEGMCDRNGELGIRAMSRLLNDVCDMPVPSWICLKFVKTQDANTSGKFSFAQFADAFLKIMTAIKEDIKREIIGQPEWLTTSKKTATKILTNPGYKSASQIAGLPLNERKFTQNNGGMWSCDHDMLNGTTRSTYHLPGYSGHIPMSTINPIVAKQSNAQYPREQNNNLRLIFKHDLPGYTGHQPEAARNDVGVKKGGLDPRTTAGSAALGEDIL